MQLPILAIGVPRTRINYVTALAPVFKLPWEITTSRWGISSLCRHNTKQTIKNITTKLKNNINKINNKHNIGTTKNTPETDFFENITLWRRWLSALDTRNRIQYTLLGSKFSYCTLWTGAKQWSGNCWCHVAVWNHRDILRRASWYTTASRRARHVSVDRPI